MWKRYRQLLAAVVVKLPLILLGLMAIIGAIILLGCKKKQLVAFMVRIADGRMIYLKVENKFFDIHSHLSLFYFIALDSLL